MADLRRSVGSTAATDAFDPVLHVILIVGLALGRFSFSTVGLLGPIFQGLIEVVLECAIASKDAITQSVMLVAEGGLPGHDDVLGKIERDRDGVGNFPSVFLR